MTAGVTFEFHIFNLMISMCVFIGVGCLYGLIFIPIHALGFMVCRYDVHFFKIIAKRFLSLPLMSNVRFWGVRTYEPF